MLNPERLKKWKENTLPVKSAEWLKSHSPQSDGSARYSEQLKDPRWQKKRLEIMQRDNFACYLCDDPTSTLHVHHRNYNNEAEGPWDYEEYMLLTVCKDCHDWLHGLDQMANHRVEKLISFSLYLGRMKCEIEKAQAPNSVDMRNSVSPIGENSNTNP